MAPNVADSKGSILIDMSSSILVLIDPLVLDGLSAELQRLEPSEVADNPGLIRTLPGPMRVGLHQIEDFAPGAYYISNYDLESVGTDQANESVFDIDTGTLVLADLSHLPRLAQILTWERYDAALTRPPDDETCWLEFTKELGGTFWGILWGDIDTPFKGDGSYRIKAGAPRFHEPLKP